MSFYIEKIIVTGSGKTDSIIELSNGVNIIYGPSNTGKTYIVKPELFTEQYLNW